MKNIELYVEVPKTFEEETIQINSLIEIESSSRKKLKLQINIILTTILISIMVSCKEYELIKQKIDDDKDISFVQCFKINAKEFIDNEEINFELLNYNNQDSIDFI